MSVWRDACVPAPLGNGIPAFDDDFHERTFFAADGEA